MATATPLLISNWSAECCPRDFFTAPEARDHIHLAGDIAGRGGRVLTSRVVATKGRIVTTRSGSVYRLGRPAPKFLAWLRERGKPYDRAEPIKVLHTADSMAWSKAARMQGRDANDWNEAARWRARIVDRDELPIQYRLFDRPG